MGNKKCSLTKEILIEEFIINKMTVGKISEKYNCHRCTVRVHLKKYGLYDEFESRVRMHEKIGKRFGFFEVLEACPQEKKRQQYTWKVICRGKNGTCGNIRYIKSANLTRFNEFTSCGCEKAVRSHTDQRWKGYGEISNRYFKKIIAMAKIRNLEFNLTIEYLWDLFLKQDRKCALSGLNIEFCNQYKDDSPEYGKIHTVSLDRIDSSKGYVIGNVQWVHKYINLMKLDFTQEEFIYYCLAVTNNTKLE